MFLDTIIKKFIKNKLVIKGGLEFPENAPILIKAFKMNYGWCKLAMLIWRNKSIAKKKQEQFNSSYLKALHWSVDFDLTEEYIWWRVIETNKDIKC